jgi:hypothetical protein
MKTKIETCENCKDKLICANCNHSVSVDIENLISGCTQKSNENCVDSKTTTQNECGANFMQTGESHCFICHKDSKAGENCGCTDASKVSACKITCNDKWVKNNPLNIALSKKRVIAFCNECGANFTEWISDSTECPECEGQMVIKSILDEYPLNTFHGETKKELIAMVERAKKEERELVIKEITELIKEKSYDCECDDCNYSTSNGGEATKVFPIKEIIEFIQK